MPTDILIAGCGDLGSALGQDLVTRGYRVAGLRRNAALLPGGIRTLSADVTQAHTLDRLAELRPSILVYSVSANAQSDDNYRAHYVDGLRNTLTALEFVGSLRHVFFVSSTRVYGPSTEEFLNERTPAIPADFGGRRLLEAESLLATAACPGTVLRLSGIYGPSRTRLLKLAANPADWPAQNTWTNRIHRDDAAAFIALLIQRVMQHEAVEDCYVVTDSKPAPQYEVLRWLAREMGVAELPATDPAVIGGKKLDNTRMLETGFMLRYPSYREGYAHELRAYLTGTI
ncbi:MAG TPA: SDR family oxidoreductase [Methylophilaceae bacterium]|jgi:nucleoside-diphosphate-sugar epimerase|nr:SDR family oxidoreductase [Methylophilaceae bacterium]